MPFRECHDVDAIEPLPEYVELWETQKAELRAVGSLRVRGSKATFPGRPAKRPAPPAARR